MLSNLLYSIKGGTQNTEAASKSERKKKIILLSNAPLGFRKLQKVDGAGGGMSGVSWWRRMGYRFRDQKRKAISQGSFAEGKKIRVDFV